MEFWLDTVDFNLIAKANQTIKITGVTTNPSILASSPLSVQQTLQQLLTVQKGLVAAQVTADDTKTMIKQAQQLHAISPGRIVIKIPVTEDGLAAIFELSKQNILTLATAIFEPSQVLAAILAGATYAAPYLARINPNIDQAYLILQAMLDIVRVQQAPIKIMAAAIQHKSHIVACAKLGVPAMTVPALPYQEFMDIHPETQQSLIRFKADWLEKNDLSVI